MEAGRGGVGRTEQRAALPGGILQPERVLDLLRPPAAQPSRAKPRQPSATDRMGGSNRKERQREREWKGREERERERGKAERERKGREEREEMQ
eukprot:SAG22_NODE_6133_length_894_cov_2.319497_1_plen_93_part_01